jgi:hypothetical protein
VVDARVRITAAALEQKNRHPAMDVGKLLIDPGFTPDRNFPARRARR